MKNKIIGLLFVSSTVIFMGSLAKAERAKIGLQHFLSYFQKNDQTERGKVTEVSSKENCMKDELQVFEIENALLKPWREAIQNQSSTENIFFNKKESTRGIFPQKIEFLNTINGIKNYVWNLKTTTMVSGNNSDKYNQILYVDMSLNDYVVVERDNQDRITHLDAFIDIKASGLDKKNYRRSDRGKFKVVIKKSDRWKIFSLEPIQGISLISSREPSFQEETERLNLSNLPVYARTEAIRRGGYALAIADINGDKYNDLMVGMREGIKLFLGQEGGKFSDATTQSGLEKLKYVKTAIFADFENRGIQDLVVTTLQPGTQPYNRGSSSVLAFSGDGKGQFKLKNINFGNKRGFLQPMPAAVADFNNDGFLDIYVGYPGAKDFTVFQKQIDKKEAQGLYINNKKGGFDDFTDLFEESDGFRQAKLFPHAAMAVNFDQIGGVDLLVADDRNNLSPAYLNNGEKSFNFKERAKQIGIGNVGYAMSIAASDINNDGITDLAWTNVNFSSAQRLTKACQRHWKVKGQMTENGLRIFKGLGKGSFVETSKSLSIEGATGEGGAGLTFFDYNNDGLIDIYLVNGLWSGSEKGQELQSIFSTMVFASGESLVHILKPENQGGFKEVLTHMKGSIDRDLNIVKGNERPSLAGYQRNHLFHNNGNGTFTDVAFFEGVDSIADGYIVGTRVNEKGLQDLILRNGDPGTSSFEFPVLQVYKNNFKKPGKSLRLTLEGSKSNRDAIGTYVIANFGDRKQVQHLISNSGSVQSERIIHFGLGESDQISDLKIYWPSGNVQEVRDIKAGHHHIVEQNISKVSQK